MTGIKCLKFHKHGRIYTKQILTEKLNSNRIYYSDIAASERRILSKVIESLYTISIKLTLQSIYLRINNPCEIIRIQPLVIVIIVA